jgi:hypothetical protein
VELIEDAAPIALTDVILTEILKGLRSEREARLVETQMRAFPVLRMETLDDFALDRDFDRLAECTPLKIFR